MPFEGHHPVAGQPEVVDDQLKIEQSITDALKVIGIDLEKGAARRKRGRIEQPVILVQGKAGTGKTHLLARLSTKLIAAGVERADEDDDGSSSKVLRFSVISPTNKAATVLRRRGVEATTIHRIAYVPVYAADMERLRTWLGTAPDEREAERPKLDKYGEDVVDRIVKVYEEHQSIPAALAAVGLSGADFISGWTLRQNKIDVGLVDEASMLDGPTMADCLKIFRMIIAFGDPAQLAPIKSKGMAISDPQFGAPMVLTTIRRQALENPIVMLAHELQNPELGFEAFERRLREISATDPEGRIKVEQAADPELMAEAPLLCWMNRTRIDAIKGWRKLFGLPEDSLGPGEPVIVEGIDLPPEAKKSRLKLERRGIIKGAQARYVGAGAKPNFARLSLEDGGPQVSVAAIVRIETEVGKEAHIGMAAKRGVILNCAAAITCHKAQGSEFRTVSIFGPDIEAAARSGRMEDGVHLWRRLAYVALTRAQHEVRWITQKRFRKPTRTLAQIVGLEDQHQLGLSEAS